MKSPFPGMDPYLQRRWGDVHNRLIGITSAVLQPVLPTGLRARGEQDIRLQNLDDPNDRLLFEGGIAVVETGPYSVNSRSSNYGGTAVANAPIRIRLAPVVEKHSWVQIIDTSDGNRVITVIEILGPGDKSSSKLNRRYRKKLKKYQRAGVSVVEIDLLRSSRSRLLLQSEDFPPPRRAAYYTSVNRAKDPDGWAVYPMPLRSPLPTIPIPCRETDPDVPLALQPILDRVYLEGGHDDIDYAKPPDPPFDPHDADWAALIVSAARARV